MSAKTIKTALGLLQDDPESAEAWQELRGEVRGDPGMVADELRKLLEAARRAHEARREYEAVARLLEIEADAAEGAARQVELLSELAHVVDEELLDDDRANAVYDRLLSLRPDDAAAAEAKERSLAKRAKWRELVDRYLQEASHTADSAFRSSLLVGAAEATYRFGRRDAGKEAIERIVRLLRDALQLDPKNRRAEMLLERVLRDEGRWDELARALERFATDVPQRDEKISAWVRLGRVFRKKLESRERAAAAYERVLDLAPGHSEASSFLSDYFTSSQMWDHLIAMYEEQLAAGVLRGKEEEFGATLQIAMVHWRMRGRPEAAEPWFEKLRKLDPGHPGMLTFFREWCSARGEGPRLAAILTDAQRALSDGAARSALVAEIARLAEEGANAQKAIEQWRALLRQDPRNVEARDALKRLYRQTANWSALTDLLRQELERIPLEDAVSRLIVLRDIASIYRSHVKSDSALVSILTQIAQLDPTDLACVRELVRVYEALQRWRDLLAAQARQAELETETSAKAELWRAIGRRWLDQFSNVQNAMEAFEKLRALLPSDNEAVSRLRELYVKRRAYKALYDLLGEQAEAMPSGVERRELWMEMAKLAAERLDMGPQSAALYKRVLDEDPRSAAALDALEKQAERDKDFATVAEALERRSQLTTDPAARLAVLQKLGTVYSERLRDSPMAMSAWRRVLSLQPGHAKALRVLRDSYLGIGDFDGLTELYAQNGDWESLAEVLSGAADKATEPALKVDLSFRCAQIYVGELHAPERAFRAYERVLSVVPDDARAAAALVPLYEKDEKWGRLPALYEILLGHAAGLEDKLELLGKLGHVTGQQLQDRPTSFQWAIKTYELAPERQGALEGFEQAARFSGQWAGFVEAISTRLQALDASIGTPRPKKKKKKDQDNAAAARGEERRALRAKLAEVYAAELGRMDEAVQIYRALVEEDETDDSAVQTLDRILRESDRRDDLRWLFDVRVERANTALKIELLSDWAMLEEEAFGAPDRAAELYRRTLQVVPHHGGALRALARLLRARGDAEGAAEVIAMDRDQREGADRAAREIELAKLYADPLRRYVEALSACERALQLAPNDARAMSVVEQLLPIPETRAKAAAILERAYDETGASRPQADVLEVLVATTAARDDRVALYGKLADVHERKLGNPDAAFDVIARAASEYPTDLALWDRLAVLAAKTGRVQGLVDAIVAVVPPEGASGLPEHVELDLAERVATLFDEKLDDADRAGPYLERMLARQPGNERAFQRLKQILTMREQWSELGHLYERAVEAAVDPRRRAELLAEVALVVEEIIGDRPKAIEYYERILEIDPANEQATRSLDALYEAEQRWDRLAQLLERRLRATRGDERLDLQQRLGTLLFTRMGDATGALSNLEVVLRERPAATVARQLVEKILDVPDLRSRAAVVLEAVYTSRDDVTELVRVLEIHLEFAHEVPERRDLLRRVAQLRDERLRDDAGALEAFARLLPLDPDDAPARQRMLEIARRLGTHERAAGVLLATAAAASAPMPRADIFMDVARIYESHLGEPSRAEAIYRQVLTLAPEDASIALPACRSLERIYSRGDSRQLCEILRIEVGLESDAAARRELRGRLGELCENVLDDPRGAIDAWRTRLDDDPTDSQALTALDRLYDRTHSWRELVDVLRTRERMTDSAPARREFLVRVATTLADKLSDSDEAIAAYRAVIDEFGADRASLSALASLYQQSNRWRELAETLEADMALADSPGDKLALLARLGDVRRAKLDDTPSAIDAYRRALVIEPSNARARAALEAMLEEPSAQKEVAAILRPLYEKDGLHDRLLRVLEIEAEHADSVVDRLATIARSVEVAEGPLGASARAFSYAARGLREAVAEPELPAWLDRVERLAALSDKYAELVQLLRSAVDDIAEASLELEVTLRIADLARQRLSDPVLAKQYYVHALELQGDERRALVALESLYEETGEHGALLEIVKRRADLADNDAIRRQLLFKQARLCDEKIGDAHSAIAVYEQILDMGLDAEAIEALQRLYAREGRWDDLVALYERQIVAPGVPNERRAALHHALGEVLEKGTREYERAFDEYAAALAIDAKHPQTIASLEGLMAQREHAARASTMLEPVYIARLDWRRVMATLEARLAVSQEPHERKQLLRRLSKLHEEQEENYAAALETTAQLLGEEPTDETTWSELERLARVANAQGRLAEAYAAELQKITADEPATAKLARRTGELFEAQNDVDRALLFYRRAHAFEPEDEASFVAIDRLLQSANRPAERVRLYRDSLDYENDPRERLRALQTIARIQETELHDDAAAVETYRAALEIDDGESAVLDALSTLYERGARWHDLAEFTRRRAEQSAFPEDEARFRTSLAKLLIHRLDETAAGLDELQTVVDLTATQRGGPGAETIAELEALLRSEQFKPRAIDILRPIYERADDWRRLISLNEQRLGIAADDGERIAIWRENALLWEQRGKDPRKAFDAIREAWTLDPEDGEARQQLDRIGASTGRWDDLAEAYETSISRSDGATKRELLSALAHLHDRRRDDPRRALDAWERLFFLDESDLQPLEEMDALATLLSDWQTLVRVLARKAELVSDDESRATTWRRIGEARRDMLDDSDGAIAAFERAFELEPASASTVDQLIALYEQKRDASRLVDLYRRRVELCAEGEDELRFSLLVGAASSYETDLSNRREAIECLTQALAVKPGEPEVLRKLDALYTQEHLWPELLDNLKLQADGSKDAAVRLGLKKRIAALYAVELQDPRSALETYRDILQASFDEESVAAIRGIGESRDELRLEAADVLEPVLYKAGRHSDVAAVLELRLRAQTETDERTRTLRALATIAESSLGDLDRAQSALIRALAEEPGDPSLHSEVERLANRAGTPGWQRYADALQERAATVFEASVAADLFVRLGRSAEEKLDDPRRAANAYAAASERLGDDASVLSALDRLLERLDEKQRLAEVIERRIAVESDARLQADLSFRLGQLQLHSFHQKAEGLASFRRALERVPEHSASQEAIASLLEDDVLFEDAFEALETVYRTTRRNEDVARLYERRVARARTTRERTRASLELAHVLETTVGDRARAQRAVQAALSTDPGEEEALAELERLATANSGWSDATATLAASLGAASDLPAATRMDLWVRLAGWYRDRLGDVRLAESAYSQALAIDPENLDVLRALEDLRRAPGRERDLVQTLRTRARLETDAATKRELLREAKALAETPVGDRELAEATLRDLISEDERDIWALEELTRLRSTAGDEAEVVKLLLRRSELVDDAKAAGSLQHEAAQALVEKLNDVPRATSLYEEILDADPEDSRAATALRALYVRAGRDRDLGKLLQRLIDGASGSRKTDLRLELARLQADRFKAPEDAIETLGAVLDDEPTHADAVLLLSQLYEQTERDAELAELLKAQLEAARSRQDVPTELALLVRLAEVQERRLGDVSAAQQAYEQVLQRNPYHRAALEAVARIAESRADWDRAATALSRLLDFATEPSGVTWALRLAEAREKTGDATAVEDALQRGLKLEESNTSLRTMLRVRWERVGKWQELADLLVGDADLVKASSNHDNDVQSAKAESQPTTGAAAPVRGSLLPPPPAVSNSTSEQVTLLKTAAQIHLTRLHRPDQAIPVLERAAQLVPQDRELLLTLCDAYNAAQRGRDAAQVLEKVIASFGSRRTKEVALYHHRLARALTQLGDKNVALTQLDMAFKIDPSSVGVLRDLGVLAFETNDLERAQRTFRALLLQRLDANAGISKGEVFCYLGEISAKQGDRAKALQMFERAIENDPALERARTKLSELKG
ncbi:MAG TPA: tetratricopeptide repeat protein [Polyangiaceae bacterium]|nr:tetratricopeptide repeat protein [Polyangiaceae bacterium]